MPESMRSVAGSRRVVRVALHGAQVIDEFGDGRADGLLRRDVPALFDPELVTPDRHRSRAVGPSVDAATIDDVAHQHRRKLSISRTDAREIGHGGIQAARHGPVAAGVRTVTAGAEAPE